MVLWGSWNPSQNALIVFRSCRKSRSLWLEDVSDGSPSKTWPATGGLCSTVNAPNDFNVTNPTWLMAWGANHSKIKEYSFNLKHTQNWLEWNRVVVALLSTLECWWYKEHITFCKMLTFIEIKYEWPSWRVKGREGSVTPDSESSLVNGMTSAWPGCEPTAHWKYAMPLSTSEKTFFQLEQIKVFLYHFHVNQVLYLENLLFDQGINNNLNTTAVIYTGVIFYALKRLEGLNGGRIIIRTKIQIQNLMLRLVCKQVQNKEHSFLVPVLKNNP